MVPIYKFDIVSIAADTQRKLLLDCTLGEEFIMIHDLSSSSTSLILREPSITMKGLGIGMEIEENPKNLDINGNFTYVPLALLQSEDQRSDPVYPLDNIYNLFGGYSARVFTAFYPSSMAQIRNLNHDIEHKISGIEVRATHNSGRYSAGQSISKSTDSYYRSFELKLLSMMLDNTNDIQLARSSSYNVVFIIEQTEHLSRMLAFLKSNSIVLGSKAIKTRNICEMFSNARRMEAMPLSYTNASKAICISNRIRRTIRLPTASSNKHYGIIIGKYLDGGSEETKDEVSIPVVTLNLGMIITGLPGTGKTRTAKSIIEQALVSKPAIAIISPTGEWNDFGHKNALTVVEIGDPRIRINFFKCETSSVHRFYENLSMLIAAGCNSEPYRNSIEKCLLAAFSKSYKTSRAPDPQEVYEEIEESIIEQHGRRTPTSVKYTKHGENIKASLEGLRQLLMKQQFAYTEGISFAEFLKKGVIFDLSSISNSSKPLVYALLLNQIYTLCDDFDVNGNDLLRMVLCLEEAQLVFNHEDESSATADLKERIQNFRKNGVGLILISHNVTDISPTIRRLCQTKLYFRQSADVAKFAANDLVFNELDYDKVTGMLKTLGQRICAMSAITLHDEERVVNGSLFTKVNAYEEINIPAQTYPEELHGRTEIRFPEGSPFMGHRYELFYLRERVSSGTIATVVREEGFLENRKYKLVIIMDKKKDNKEFDIKGGASNTIPGI